MLTTTGDDADWTLITSVRDGASVEVPPFKRLWLRATDSATGRFSDTMEGHVTVRAPVLYARDE